MLLVLLDSGRRPDTLQWCSSAKGNNASIRRPGFHAWPERYLLNIAAYPQPLAYFRRWLLQTYTRGTGDRLQRGVRVPSHSSKFVNLSLPNGCIRLHRTLLERPLSQSGLIWRGKHNSVPSEDVLTESNHRFPEPRRGTVIEASEQKEMYEKGHDRDDKIDNDFGLYSAASCRAVAQPSRPADATNARGKTDREGPTGGTLLSKTTFIQRLNTNGGSAPQ